MTRLYGTFASYALFTDEAEATGVIIDTDLNIVDDVMSLRELADAHDWERGGQVDQVTYDLAAGALADLSVRLVASAGRMYTIPAGAKAEAERGLEWRKEHKRGGTPVGVNTARTLARGGQIGIQKVRHIAKYFPRHEVDKKGKGYKPGNDGYPSAGRIAWALWGGDVAWRWARAIVERENRKKKSMRADGTYIIEDSYDDLELYADDMDPRGDIGAFKQAMEDGDEFSPEFIARVRQDGTGIDRIYKVENDGAVFVWDDGAWDDLGTVDGDILTYDRALDEPYDNVEKHHIILDAQSALLISARLQQDPFCSVRVEDLEPEEVALATAAMDEIDWDLVDRALVSAGEAPLDVSDGDGVYTPEERSAKARKQVRDKGGRFAQMGSRVRIGDGADAPSGTIKAIDPDNQTVTVDTDSGQRVTVPGNTVSKVDETDDLVYRTQQAEDGAPVPLDTSGILARPRAPIDRPNAYLPGGMPALTGQEMQGVLKDWPAWVKSQRDRQQAERVETETPIRRDSGDYGKVPEKTEYQKKLEQESGKKLILDAREHPMLKSFFKRKKESAFYYSPITSAAAPTVKGESITPTNSDVQPMYVAIVSPDDPRAVLDLVSIVPASTTSMAPMTYKRVNGKWELDAQILADLNSPTPPPVVPLHGAVLEDVVAQVDGGLSAAALAEFAQGGIDRNRGNAERLRRYWVYGRGALKIKWGAPGDWKRCVRHLAKYMGPRAKGYCNLRHKDALKIWPATHAKLLRGGRKRGSMLELGVADLVDHEDVFGVEHSPTEVTPDDLERDIVEIERESDDMYEGGWEPDDDIVRIIIDLGDLLDDDQLLASALVAKGGFDRNRGNAEKLRRYWLYGKGALKIRWNTPGDWTRCYRQLFKYMGPRAKGYCALRHKEATGLWTGDRLHRKMYGWGRNKAFSSVDVASSEQFVASGLAAILAGGGVPGEGARFYIPIVIPEGVESGDGRIFKKGAITMRELPLPLLWQVQTSDGHNGSVVVGRIDSMERGEDGIVHGRGVFDTSPHACEVERMVREGFIRGVSADLDQFEASSSKKRGEVLEKAEDEKIGGEKITITKARVMAVTVVPKPAFEQCKIMLETSIEEQVPQEDAVITDGEYIEEMDAVEAASVVACGAIASSIPVVPPADWFTNPKLSTPTPLTVDDSGRVFGHIAAWNVDHIGMATGTKPPRSKSNYAYFHTGVLRVDSGKDVPVGQLTLAGGHAPLDASAVEAVRHYDDTASAIADVHAGEDTFGIWVAGALRPGTTPEQVRAFRASAPSGDWRPIKGSLELVAVCQVNVPGFPIARARVAGGQVYALVAAGASVLAKLRRDPLVELAERVEKLEAAERAELVLKASAVSAKFTEVRHERAQELAVKAAAARARVEAEAGYDELGYISMDRRRKLASEGKALPDGSYPIRNVEELKDAIQAYGRGKPSKRAAIRRHIMKRARGLKRADLIPDKWRELSILDDEDAPLDVDALRAKVAAAQAVVEFADISEEARKRLAEEGKALPDGSYPIRNVDDLKNAIRAYGRSKPSDRAKVRRHIMKRARQLKQGDMIPDEWRSEASQESEFADIRTRVAAAEAELLFADISTEARERLASEGKALSDGSYPIRNEGDLKNAIVAAARAAAGDLPAVRAHIARRAQELGHGDMVPKHWSEATDKEVES